MAVSTQPAKPPEPTEDTGNGAIPPLENGDRLTRDEFERRYDAMPHVKKAELIEGEVYMPSPVRHSQHGHPHTPAHFLVGESTRRTRRESRRVITAAFVSTWITNPNPTLT